MLFLNGHLKKMELKNELTQKDRNNGRDIVHYWDGGWHIECVCYGVNPGWSGLS
jgi:hypothetical protein